MGIGERMRMHVATLRRSFAPTFRVQTSRHRTSDQSGIKNRLKSALIEVDYWRVHARRHHGNWEMLYRLAMQYVMTHVHGRKLLLTT